jgi:putative NADPH-quinone reductase
VRGAGEAGHVVQQIAIADLAFPFLRGREDIEHGATPPAVLDSQAALLRSDHIVVVFPIWNGGAPALVRAFFEQVFRSTFTFPDARPGERLGFSSYFTQRKALAGKTGRIIATMQMPGFVYRWYFRPHQEKNTLQLAGVKPLRETLLGGVDSADQRTRDRWLAIARDLGRDAA